MRRIRPPKSLVARAALALAVMGGAFALFWWRGPSFSAIGDAFKGSTIQVPAGADGVPGLSEAVSAQGPRAEGAEMK